MMFDPADLQKTNVTLKMLIDSNILLPGSKLICTNPNVYGILNPNGSIKLFRDGKIKEFEYLSGAARFVEKRSINGWLYWHVLIGNKSTSLSSFRDTYIDQHKKTSRI
ncbi:MAG: hypothetical protein QM771_02405, partial [Nitrospira sp.]